MTAIYELLRRYWPGLLLLAVMAIPALALPFAGLLLLWEREWLLYWSLGLTVLTLLPAAAIQLFWKPRAHDVQLAAAPGAPRAEERARAGLNALAVTATAADLASAESLRILLERAIRCVAAAYAPDDPAALWRFTALEALRLGEDVSRRLHERLARDVPILEHLEVKWGILGREVVAPVQRLRGAWRILRVVNPAAALASELRGLVLDQAFALLDAAVKARIAAILVCEVGAVAIDLYAGTYRRAAPRATAPPVTPAPPPAPLTLLLAGQRNAGKSSLLNALLAAARVPVGLTQRSASFTVHELRGAPDGAPLILVDSPGLSGTPDPDWREWIARVDLILWVAAANRADRAADQRALAAVRALTDADPRRHAVPLVLAATHADRLNPPREWSPPYDPAAGARPKEVSMRAALQAAADTLAIPRERAVLVAVPHGGAPWNLDGFWDAVAHALPDARRRQLERGRAPDGWFKAFVVDTARSVPEVLRQAASGLIEKR